MPQILDYLGRPIKAPSRPETREIGAVSIRDRWSSYPSAGLTPQRLAAIFYAADAGDLRSQAELFTEMRQKDSHLYSVAGTRRLAVLGLDWQVKDASEDAQDKRIGEFCRGQLKGLKLKGLMKHLLGAVGHGYAAAQIKWQTGAPHWTIRGFDFIHAKNINFLNSSVPLVVTEDNSQGEAPGAFQLAFHLYEAESGYDVPWGVFRVCAYMYLFKNFAIKDWAAFNEIFGMPLRLGKYEPSATPADREALRLAISALGTDAAGIISKSTEIEFVEASQHLSGAANPYELFANFCNREMSKAVLGQTLTTDTQGSTGTYSAGKVQQEVRQDLLEADSEALAETIRYQLFFPLVGFNFGWDYAQKALPEFSLTIQEEQDLEVDSKVVKNLKDAGAGKWITKKYILDNFGLPEPQEGEETLEVPAPETPAGGPGQPPGGPAEKAPAAPGEKEKRGKGQEEFRVLALGANPYQFENNGLSVPGSLPQDATLLERQKALDGLVLKATAASASLVHEMLAPVRELIEQGQDMEIIQARLLDLYPDLQVEALANLIYEVRMRALMFALSSEQ